jgi:hypothetical protein
VSAIFELNRLLAKYEALEKAAMQQFLSRGCGCCVDYYKRERNDKKLGKAIGAKPYGDASGYDIYSIAYKVLGIPDPSEDL